MNLLSKWGENGCGVTKKTDYASPRPVGSEICFLPCPRSDLYPRELTRMAYIPQALKSSGLQLDLALEEDWRVGMRKKLGCSHPFWCGQIFQLWLCLWLQFLPDQLLSSILRQSPLLSVSNMASFFVFLAEGWWELPTIGNLWGPSLCCLAPSFSLICIKLSALNSPSDTTRFLFLNMSCDCSLLSTSYNHCLTCIRFSLLFTGAFRLTFQTPLRHLSSSFLINMSRLYLFSFFSCTSNKNNFQRCKSINHLVLKTKPFNIMIWWIGSSTQQRRCL